MHEDGALPSGRAVCKLEHVFACERHVGRIHVCDGRRACDVYTDAMGFGTCVLSGQTVRSAENFSFEDGTGEVWEDAPRVQRSRKRPNQAAPPPPVFRAPAAGVVGHDDEPASGLFAGPDNTFGPVGPTLDALYEVAWQAVTLLLFSAERAASEHGRREALVTEATRRVRAYVTEETRAGHWAFLDVARRRSQKTMRSRRVLQPLLLPPGSVRRLKAYYSLAVMQFIVSLHSVMNALPGKNAAVDRVFACADTLLCVNALLLLGADFASRGDVVHDDASALWPGAAADPVLAMLPEAGTLSKLGLVENQCTNIRKDIKCVVTLAQRHDMAGILRVSSSACR